MAAFDNSYSRFISLAKVLLPLAALALLSTIFLVSRSVDPTASIPYAKVDVEQLVRDQGVSAPVYSALSRDGTAISFQADRVLPGAQDQDDARAQTVRLQMDYTDGGQLNVSADSGLLDSSDDQALLQGDVRILTEDGYVLTTEALIADLEGAWLRSEVQVQVTGPIGTLEAGGMEIHQRESDGGAHVVDFIGGVKLIYTPQPKEDAQ